MCGQASGEDGWPLVDAFVDDEKERGRLGGDDDVGPEWARWVHAQMPVVEGESVHALSA